MPDYELTINGKTYDVTANSEADLPAIAKHISGQSQQPAGPSPYAENPQMLQQPIEFQPRPPEEVRATLNDLPQPELAAELLKIKSPQGGAPTESNVQAMSGTLERAGSLRDVLHQEVASGGLSPTATLDPQQYPVLAPIWEQYKQEMDPSFFGAMARGAESQAGAVVGGAIGAGIGAMGAPMTGPVTPFLGRMGGAVAGAELQKAAESAFRTPQEQTAAQAQAAFDASRATTRTGTAIGEVAPHLLTMRPAFNTIERAMSGDTSAIAAVAMGAAIGGGIPAATGGGIERTIVGAVGGGLMEPRIAPRTSAVTPRQLESITAAEQAGIPVYTQDVFRPQGRTGQALQRAGEVLPFGTTSQRVSQQKAVETSIKNTLDSFGVKSVDLGETEMSPVLQNVFNSFRAKRKADLSKAQIERRSAMKSAEMTGLPVDLTNSEPALKSVLKTIENEQLSDLLPIFRKFQNQISGGALGNLEVARKQIGQELKADTLANVRKRGEQLARQLYGPVNEDIGNVIEKHGTAADRVQWKVANKKITNLNKELEINAIDAVLDKGGNTPENIKKLIFNAPESLQKVLYAQLTEKGKSNLRTAIMQQAYEDASISGQFSPLRFQKQIDKLSENLNVSFTGEQQKELRGLARAIQLTDRSQRFAPNAETGVQALPGQVMSAITKGAKGLAQMTGAVGLATHPVETLVTGAIASGMGVGLGLIARIYNSQPVRRALVRLSTAPQGTAAEQNAYRILTSAIQAEARKSTPKQESK